MGRSALCRGMHFADQGTCEISQLVSICLQLPLKLIQNLIYLNEWYEYVGRTEGRPNLLVEQFGRPNLRP